MLTTGFILVTITLIILGIISFKMSVPRASYPMVMIYIIFVYYQIPNRPQDKPDKIYDKSIERDSNPLELEQKEIKPSKKEIVADIKIDSTKIEPKSKKPPESRFEAPVKKKPPTRVSKKLPNKSQKLVNRAVSDLILKDIKICKYIKKRTPVGSDVIFSNNIDSLYCYTRIQNKGKKREVKHIWYYNDRMMTQVRYNVRKSNTFRSWTRKTIYPHQVGKWRVDIHDNNGTIIGSIDFEIKKQN